MCGEDDRLKGMLTDRDIVVKVLAQRKDPSSTTAGELGEGKPVTIGTDDSVDEALKTMKEQKALRTTSTFSCDIAYSDSPTASRASPQPPIDVSFESWPALTVAR